MQQGEMSKSEMRLRSHGVDDQGERGIQVGAGRTGISGQGWAIWSSKMDQRGKS